MEDNNFYMEDDQQPCCSKTITLPIPASKRKTTRTNSPPLFSDSESELDGGEKEKELIVIDDVEEHTIDVYYTNNDYRNPMPRKVSVDSFDIFEEEPDGFDLDSPGPMNIDHVNTSQSHSDVLYMGNNRRKSICARDDTDLFDDTAGSTPMEVDAIPTRSIAVENAETPETFVDSFYADDNCVYLAPVNDTTVSTIKSKENLPPKDSEEVPEPPKKKVALNEQWDNVAAQSSTALPEETIENGVEPMETCENSEAVTNGENPRRRSILPLDHMNLMTENPLAGIKTFGQYMQLKKDKLLYQQNLAHPRETKSSIFDGVSIFVNGYTNPTAVELKDLIQLHGGHFHMYYQYGKTTYTVAMELATSKISKRRLNEKIIRPEWIVDSVKNGHLMPEGPYLLFGEAKQELDENVRDTLRRMAEERKQSVVEIKGADTQRRLDARDPRFLTEYYANSRLHLISTLAQEMKDYIYTLKMESVREFPFKEELRGVATESTERPPPGHVIFHIDLDCFFVSVAVRKHPELKELAVAITHSRGRSEAPGFSEIASCSYAARKAGVKNGMLIKDALLMCPNLICLPYEFDEYRTVSKTIYTIISQYTLDIRAVSCDEMFINIGSLLRELHHGDARLVAEHMRGKIREMTGCAASIGIGPSQLIARLATRHAKPDGVKWVTNKEMIGFIKKQKVCDLPGVGDSALKKIQIHFNDAPTCADLQYYTRKMFYEQFGKAFGDQLYDMCRGVDEVDGLKESAVRKSVSCDINYGIRFTKIEEAHTFLSAIGAELERKLMSARMKAGSLTLKILTREKNAPIDPAKFLGCGKCDTHSRTTLLQPATKCARALTSASVRLLNRIDPPPHEMRGISVHLTRLEPLSAVARKMERVDAVQICEMFRSTEEKKKERLKKRLGEDLEHDRLCEAVLDDLHYKEVVAAFPVPPIPQEDIDRNVQINKMMKEWKEEAIQSGDPSSHSAPLPAPPQIHPFNQWKTMAMMEMRMREMMLECPAKDSVWNVFDYTYSLIRYSSLPRLKKFMNTAARVCKMDDSSPGWYDTIFHISQLVDDLCVCYHDAPIFRGTLFTEDLGPYINNEWQYLPARKVYEEEMEKEAFVPFCLADYGL